MTGRFIAGFVGAALAVFMFVVILGAALDMPAQLSSVKYASRDIIVGILELPLWARSVLGLISCLMAAYATTYAISGKDVLKIISDILMGRYEQKYQTRKTIDAAHLIHKDNRIQSISGQLRFEKEKNNKLKKDNLLLENMAKLALANEWKLVINDKLNTLKVIESELKESCSSTKELQHITTRIIVNSSYIDRKRDMFPDVEIGVDYQEKQRSPWTGDAGYLKPHEIAVYGYKLNKEIFLHNGNLIRKSRSQLMAWLSKYESYSKYSGEKLAKREKTNS